MPAPVAGIHVFMADADFLTEGVDGRDKPGHDVSLEAFS